MIRLRPITTEQTFSIIPSSFAASDLNAATISLVENGTNSTESDVAFTWAASDNGNFINLSVTPTITLSEGQIYTLELYTNSKLLYRDLVYITASTSKVQVFSAPNDYVQYDGGDDEYIVL